MITVVLGGLMTGLSGQSVVQEELERRRDRVIAAEEALMMGDEAYQGSDFQAAVDSYRQAYAQMPDGDKTLQLREAARERYAQAAVQAARVMNRQGDRAGAIALVDEVLAEAVYPDYFPAQKLRAQLDDPIRTNPSATAEHGQKVDEVRRLLYQAEGAYNLGKFDESTQLYEKVLRLDPYNVAARRGMERTNARISDYAGSAYDHTRAEMLSQVGAQWESDVPQASRNLDLGEVGVILEDRGAQLDRKLDTIFIPFVNFDGVTLEEAIEYLEARAFALDPEVIEEKKGMDFVLNMGSGNSPEVEELLSRTFTFTLRNVPLRQVLDYIARQSGTVYQVDSYAVVIKPAFGLTDDLVVRRYKVPPNFLSQTSGSTSENDDIFAREENTPRLAPRLSAREFLQSQGVPFPDGASATYNASLGELVVKTSSSGQDDVSRIVDAINLQEPMAVIIDSKIVRISEENLEELAVDTALENLAASGDLVLGGGTVGSGRQSDFFGGDPLSAGLRSGDFATSGDPFQELLNRERRQVPSSVSTLFGSSSTLPQDSRGTVNSAPGVLSVVGSVNDHAYSALLRGLNQKKGADVLSQPSVVTRSGQQALVESTRDFIFPTEYEPPEVPNSIGADTLIDLDAQEEFSPTSFSATPSHPTAFDTRKLGTFLEVQPTVSQDRTYTDLAVNLKIDEFLGFVNYGEPIQGGNTQADFGFNGIVATGQTGEVTSNDILMPLFNNVQLNTNVSVATGRTLLIGGMLKESIEDVEDKVPVLGDLPLVGSLFKSDALRRKKELVMIFITVRIVDPGGNPIGGELP
ncbi:Amuc_1098 family type IV pilus outer membrane protein [Roseibacillus ishigakijimensis]|uniref:Type II/III secretion system secretin-like domain-containing protein n=1 Tax=Roseibacillus ishigakijimensis TaxID=454146 RepID=A0A934RQX7_9BACT|nr:Amuc_1098 family type IV pilus outer membrane protein [Roseibacillus ishigakijimensis]MBK1833818.1 hypothetical protein [Roseibacillus ishigakijimensis]